MTDASRRRLLDELNAKIGAIEALSAEREGWPSDDVPSDGLADAEALSPDAEAEKAFQKLLQLIAIREHSTKTMTKRLAKADFSPDAIDIAVARAVAVGLIDDRRYADSLIRGRLASGKGLQPVWREIEGLGIDPHTLEAYEDYAEGGDEAERKRARAFLDRHPTRSKQLREGAYRKLVGQGFPSALAANVAREWARENARSIPTDNAAPDA